MRVCLFLNDTPEGFKIMCAIELQVDEDNCRRGLVVTRGPAWDWGEQDGGDGKVGVILRQFYVDNPYRHTDKGLAEFENGEEAFAHTFDAPKKLCLVQVRWASACVQTYRIGTYGQQYDLLTQYFSCCPIFFL